jgi:hypothetical protein
MSLLYAFAKELEEQLPEEYTVQFVSDKNGDKISVTSTRWVLGLANVFLEGDKLTVHTTDATGPESFDIANPTFHVGELARYLQLAVKSSAQHAQLLQELRRRDDERRRLEEAQEEADKRIRPLAPWRVEPMTIPNNLPWDNNRYRYEVEHIYRPSLDDNVVWCGPKHTLDCSTPNVVWCGPKHTLDCSTPNITHSTLCHASP